MKEGDDVQFKRGGGFNFRKSTSFGVNAARFSR
jgi:hypothetical protein